MKKKLGEILVTSGAVSGTDVDAALADQSAGEPGRLGDLLVATGKLTSSALAKALAEQYQLPYVELPHLPQAVLDLVPLDLQRQFRVVPLKSEGAELWIAMADLANIEVLALLEQQWTNVHVHVSGGDEIDALHATLSGIFSSPLPLDGAPRISLSPSVDDLFGSFDLDAVPDLGLDSASGPFPVPVIAPVNPSDKLTPPRPSPLPHSSAPLAEDLFGDLNLESSRTGIAANPPEDTLAEPVKNVTMPLGAVTIEMPTVIPVEAVPEASGISEGSGPMLIGIREGTGPLLDMLLKEGTGSFGEQLLKEGTGPVMDTPFFRDSAVGKVVPAMSDAPFVSSRSSPGALAIPPPQPTAPAPEVTGRAAPMAMAAPLGEVLPDWLRTAPAAVPEGEPGAWTGALDHLMPSKLVVGLTRALLARGLVTEEEILAALGQKK